MEHSAKAKDGGKPVAKFVSQCSLPLTGKRCVHMLITDLAVFTFDESKSRFTLIELAPDVTVEQVREHTEAAFDVAPNVTTVSV
jgi:acyl CoA:acetate/3-ketoacid CoA transferase beta subunit